MQNSALGAVLAAAHFPAHPLAVVPCAISACTHSVMGSLLAAVWRTRPAGLADESAPLEQQGWAPPPAGAALQQAKAAADQQLAAAKAAMAATANVTARKADVVAWVAAYRQRSAPGAAAAAAPATADSSSSSTADAEADAAARRQEMQQ